MKSQFIGNLDVRHIEGPWWRLLKPFGYYSAKYNITICTPSFFVTDFASVPRLPVAYWIAGGTGNEESVPHDLGYRWFSERHMFDMIFFESGIVRSNMRSNQKLLYQYGRYLRNISMTGMVISVGWAVKKEMPGCLDYRFKKICVKENKICVECHNYYPKWELCKMNGFRPDILEFHSDLEKDYYYG